MIERWALVSGLKGDLDTYELIQKDLKKTPGNITLFVLGDMIGPEKNCNRLLHRLINPKSNDLQPWCIWLVGRTNPLGKWLPWGSKS